MKTTLRRLLSLALLAAAATTASAQTPTPTAFTYQGKLTNTAGAPVNTPTTLRFQLFSSAEGGTSLAGPVTRTNGPVTDGLFSTDIDFGNIFQSGNGGWVEIAVIDAQGNATVLTPRQRVAPAPLASGIVGLQLTPSTVVSEIDNTASPTSSIFGGGNAVNGNTGYLYFRAGQNGRLGSITMRRTSTGSTPTFFATVYAGQGVAGPALGSTSLVLPSNQTDITLDFTGLNIELVANQTYTMSVLCGASFFATGAPAPNTGGVDRSGIPVNWWFRVVINTPILGVPFASRADNATTAASAATAAAVPWSGVSGVPANVSAAFSPWQAGANGSIAYTGGAVGIGIAAPAFPVHVASPATVVGQIEGGSTGGTWMNLYNSTTGGRYWKFISTGSGNGEGAGHLIVGRSTSPTAGIDGYSLFLNGANGNVSIGTANATQRLTVAGNVQANNVSVPSSARFKHDVVPMNDALESLRKLEGVRFTWNADVAADRPGRERDIGFVAEDVAKVFPEVVFYDDKGNVTGMDYSRLTAVAVQALKQQQARIDAIEKQNAELLDRLRALEAKAAE